MSDDFIKYRREDWGLCPVCNSPLINAGAVSDGDGDLYDELYCMNCEEVQGRANERWIGLDGEWYDDYDERNLYDEIYETEAGRTWRLIRRLAVVALSAFMAAGVLRLVGVLGSTWLFVGLVAFCILGLREVLTPKHLDWDFRRWAVYPDGQPFFRRGKKGG